ncbi:MAG: hypothetical protein AAGB29_01600 [Planctomycetota bacterium]
MAACVGLLVLSSPAISAASPPSDQDSTSVAKAEATLAPIYGALAYIDIPDLGLQPIKMFYGAELWPGGQGKHRPVGKDRLAFRLSQKDTELICFNIEHWPTHGLYGATPDRIATGRANFQQMSENIAAAREAAGRDFRFGYYGGIPASLGRNIAARSAAIDRVQTELAPLIEQVDVVFISLYSRWDAEFDAWQKRAEAYLTLRERHFPDKPVIVFLGTRWHPAALPGKEGARNEMLADQIAWAQRRTDGIVLWGGWAPEGRRIDWAEDEAFVLDALREVRREAAPDGMLSD